MPRIDRALATALCAAAGLTAAHALAPAGTPQPRYDGFNLVVAPGHAYGTLSARRALANARKLGASTVAVIPFLWQGDPSAANIVRGSDMSDEMLRTAIAQARSLGLRVIVKPHLWIPGSWAGAAGARSEADWRTWFDAYRTALVAIARIAANERADMLAIGTELKGTTHRPEWPAMIGAIRAAFPGPLTYFAHNLAEAETIPFWPLLDAVGVTLYPPLGEDRDRVARLAAMRTAAQGLDALAELTGKPVIVGEIGLRSAQSATEKPWESPEERPAAVDTQLQATVLADWLSVLRRPAIRGVLVWRWFTDPDAGGQNDTDFTVQNKPAEGVLLCAWSVSCAP